MDMMMSLCNLLCSSNLGNDHCQQFKQAQKSLCQIFASATDSNEALQREQGCEYTFGQRNCHQASSLKDSFWLCTDWT